MSHCVVIAGAGIIALHAGVSGIRIPLDAPNRPQPQSRETASPSPLCYNPCITPRLKDFAGSLAVHIDPVPTIPTRVQSIIRKPAGLNDDRPGSCPPFVQLPLVPPYSDTTAGRTSCSEADEILNCCSRHKSSLNNSSFAVWLPSVDGC
jgi:hypothetical protein